MRGEGLEAQTRQTIDDAEGYQAARIADSVICKSAFSTHDSSHGMTAYFMRQAGRKDSKLANHMLMKQPVEPRLTEMTHPLAY